VGEAGRIGIWNYSIEPVKTPLAVGLARLPATSNPVISMVAGVAS